MPPLAETTNDTVIYIAGFVERHIKKVERCASCLNGLSGSDIMYGELINIKNKGGLVHPQNDIFKICRNAETLLRATNTKNPNFYPILLNKIIRSLDLCKMFPDAMHNHVEESDHKLRLIRKIIEHYLKIRLHHIGEQVTTASKKTYIRNKLTKLIHFHNQ